MRGDWQRVNVWGARDCTGDRALSSNLSVLRRRVLEMKEGNQRVSGPQTLTNSLMTAEGQGQAGEPVF